MVIISGVTSPSHKWDGFLTLVLLGRATIEVIHLKISGLQPDDDIDRKLIGCITGLLMLFVLSSFPGIR